MFGFNFLKKKNDPWLSLSEPLVIKKKIKILNNRKYSLLLISNKPDSFSVLNKRDSLKYDIKSYPNSLVSSGEILNRLNHPGYKVDMVLFDLNRCQKNDLRLFAHLIKSNLFMDLPVIAIAQKYDISEKSTFLRFGFLDFIDSCHISSELKIKLINWLYYLGNLEKRSMDQLKNDLFQSMRNDEKNDIDIFARRFSLSSKEKTVLRLLVEEDWGYKEIAESLALSESGIKKRISTICQKCGVKGKKDLLDLYIKEEPES